MNTLVCIKDSEGSKEMEPIIKSDESLFLTHPSPQKYQTNMVVRMEEEKKHKAPAETYEHHQIEKKKKQRKLLLRESPRKLGKRRLSLSMMRGMEKKSYPNNQKEKVTNKATSTKKKLRECPLKS